MTKLLAQTSAVSRSIVTFSVRVLVFLNELKNVRGKWPHFAVLLALVHTYFNIYNINNNTYHSTPAMS